MRSIHHTNLCASYYHRKDALFKEAYEWKPIVACTTIRAPVMKLIANV